MATLEQLIPDVNIALAYEPEDLAYFLFEVAKSQTQNSMIHPSNLKIFDTKLARSAPSAYAARENEVGLAVSEAWNWLRVQGLLVPASGTNGSNGFCVVSRRGQTISKRDDFTALRAA